MKYPLAALAAALAATLSLATPVQADPVDPTASLNRTFTEYTGAGTIGNNNLNDNHNVYWMYESSGSWMGQAVDSWFLAWDPREGRARGSITFHSGNILFVHDDKSELISTSAFGKPGVGYDYTAGAVGLESGDKSGTSFSGHTLSLSWNASRPGDHIRVMTAVPEPMTYVLMLLGLVAVGIYAAWRSKQDD